MPDITVFKLEIDDSTFNAPFGGRARSNGAPDESSGLNVKLVAGLSVVFLLTGGTLAFVLKRRFGNSDDEADDDDDEDVAIDISETDEDDEEESEESGGIRAVIGLSFLVGTAAVVKRKLGVSEVPSRAI
jgi:hypothetical protein